MDYSLLLIVVEINEENEETKNEIEKLFSQPRMIRRIFKTENIRGQQYIYCLGIIDYLQKYNFSKEIEHKFKRIIHDERASAVDPTLYSIRMMNFLKQNML